MFLIPQHYYKLNFLSTYERPFKNEIIQYIGRVIWRLQIISGSIYNNKVLAPLPMVGGRGPVVELLLLLLK